MQNEFATAPIANPLTHSAHAACARLKHKANAERAVPSQILSAPSAESAPRRVDCIYGNAAARTGTQISEQVHTMKLDLSAAEQTMLLFSCLGIKKSDVTGREVDFSFILWFVISFMGVLFSPEVARPTLQTYKCNLIIF